MTEKEHILRILEEKGVPFEDHSHEPLGNVLERFEKNYCFDCVVCKNLFVTTRNRNRIFLIMLRAEKKADLHKLAKTMNTTHLGFAPAEMLKNLLHQEAGSVGPLGILRDTSHTVEVILDESLRNQPRVAMHPSDSAATVVLAMDELERVIRGNANSVIYIEI